MFRKKMRRVKDQVDKQGRLPLCSDFIFTLVLLICFLAAGCRINDGPITGKEKIAGITTSMTINNNNMTIEQTDVITRCQKRYADSLRAGEKTAEKADLQAGKPFGIQMKIAGAIGYFAGQTNALGQKRADHPHRFLAMEKLRVYLDFTSPPRTIRLYFASQEYNLAGVDGQTHYETYLHIPELPSTLSWTDQRLAPSMTIQAEAVDRSTPPNHIGAVIDDIELTGSVHDIVHAQIAGPD